MPTHKVLRSEIMEKIHMKSRNLKTRRGEPAGQVMVIALLFLVVVLILVTSLYSRVIGFVHFGSRQTIGEQAIALAEAGVDYALLKLNQTNGNFSGQPTIELGAGEFKLTIDPAPPRTLAKVTSTGCIPNCTNPIQKRVIKVEVVPDGQQISFACPVLGNNGVLLNTHDGTGLITVNSNVCSNDEIEGDNCGFGRCGIFGDGWAVKDIAPDIFVSNRLANQGPPPKPLPTIDDSLWERTARAGGITDCLITPAKCQITTPGTYELGPQKYINGQLEIRKDPIVSGVLSVIIKGPIYVRDVPNPSNQGIKIENATVSLDNSFGPCGTVIITEILEIKNSNIFATSPPPAVNKGYPLFYAKRINVAAHTVNLTNEAIYVSDGKVFLDGRGNPLARFGGAAVSLDGGLVEFSVEGGGVIEYTADPNITDNLFCSSPTGSGNTWRIKRGTYKFAD